MVPVALGRVFREKVFGEVIAVMDAEKTEKKAFARDASAVEVSRESQSHGAGWASLHGGYFSSAEVAAPFVDKILDAACGAEPDVVVDLGGGTGFVLSRFADTIGDVGGIDLVDLDLAEEQLEAVADPRIRRARGSLAGFSRADIADPEQLFMFITRSTLHYLGMGGARNAISHVVSQMRSGEFFIQQTACFDEPEDALAMNMVYQMMGTGKWYPTTRALVGMLLESGFSLESVDDAPVLELTSASLGKRYGFSEAHARAIVESMREFDVGVNGIFEETEEGFVARLFYKIFVCRKI